MSKKKPSAQRKPAKPIERPLPNRLIDGLTEVETLTRRKRWAEAREMLEELNRRYPNRPEVLRYLANVYLDLHAMAEYQAILEQLSQLTPHDPEVVRGLAGAYAANDHPMLALRTFRRFLERWPDHAGAAKVREGAAEMEQIVTMLLAELGLSGADGLEFAALHEQAQVYAQQQKFAAARRALDELLRRRPDFAPALNNLSNLYFAQGQLAPALEASQQVLAFAPDNVHALSNLVRLLCLSGRAAEAHAYAERLKLSTAAAFQGSLKKMEGLSYLGDDAGVLALFETAQHDLDVADNPTIYHLAAVAALRLGSEEEARRHWRHALKLEPGFQGAKENLADLRQPIGQRNGPWAFGMRNWLTEKAVMDLPRMIEPAVRRNNEDAVMYAARRYLREHPEVISLAPVLLERGDPFAREFVLHTAMMADTPELNAVLRDFALGQHGPDAMRTQAAQHCLQAGVIPPGMTRLWLKGAWTDMLLIGFELHGESAEYHSAQVQRLAQEAGQALRQNDGERAERLWKQAVQLDPDKPDLQYNLAQAYTMQHRLAEARALMDELRQRFPDYLFGQIDAVRQFTREQRYAEGQAILDRLMTRQRWHFSEFAGFAGAQIELHLAEGNRDAARSWLEMWQQADPDHPSLQSFRDQIDGKGKWRDRRQR
jgi:tetratricopeptide (TPR) repeat protein